MSQPSPADESAEAPTGEARTQDELRRNIRGSGLLLFGRGISVLINFTTQVLTVRVLTKEDFGAFAWALAVVALGSTFGLFGMQKAVSRFLPIYLEHNDRPAQAGTIFLALATTLGLGCAFVAAMIGGAGLLESEVVSDPHAVGLLLILVALVPLQGLDNIFHSLFAVLSSPRAIFFRRHILAPLLRLAAVLVVLASAGSVDGLAWGYLIAGVFGVVTYGIVLVGLLRREGYLGQWFGKERGAVRIPLGEIVRFCAPQLTTDVLWFLRMTLSVVILESLNGTDAVAEFRAVVPVAGLSLLILESVRLLYLPLASRYFARGDRAAIAGLYANISGWITVMTFPVFAICLFLAEPVTHLLFGERYTSAAVVLEILVIGNYIDAITGVNLLTLNVFAKVRFIAWVNCLVGVISLVLYFWLIPLYGAPGAAFATAGTVVIHNAIHQVGLVRLTGVGALGAGHGRILLAVALSCVGLGLLRALTGDPWLLGAAIILVSLALIRLTRDTLAMRASFPELGKLPGARFLFGGDPPPR